MPGFIERLLQALELVEFQYGNLACRMAMVWIRDECASGIVEHWQDELSGVDLWAHTHCETILLHAIIH